MAVINFGSINIDEVFEVPHIVRPGETLATMRYQVFAGGKGANQSVALARAGASVVHVGSIGSDGLWVRKAVSDAGVNVDRILVSEGPTGRALIQVDQRGENSILILAGANAEMTPAMIDSALAASASDDWVLVQNEINNVDSVMRRAHRQGRRIAFNPSPMTPDVLNYPLHLVTLLVVNETEASELVGRPAPAEDLLSELMNRNREQTVVVTLGGHGALLGCCSEVLRVEGLPVSVVDTTAAGDTFLGYLVAGYQAGREPRDSLVQANRAAALAVTRRGAFPSIPTWQEVASSVFLPH